MIIKGSRYSQKSETRNDSTKTIAVPTKYSTNNYFVVVAQENDSFQGYAAQYLNNPTMYWKIADINPEITYPDFITPGTSVKIPL